MAGSSDCQTWSGVHMSRDRAILAVVLILPLVAAAPIPPEKCIPAAISRTLSISEPQQPMMMPTDVAVHSRGQVFVADGANDRIVRFDAAGQVLPAIQANFSRPTGIFVDADDRLWIADTGHHRVLKLSPAGTIDLALDLPPAGSLAAEPTDLLLTRDAARLYVVDKDNHRVLARDQKSGGWKTLGSSGRALGQFQYPFMIALGAEDHIYVTEAIGARVQAISPAGRWAGQISRFGVELGELYRPKGIAADHRGRLFVSDSTLGVIQVFDSRGVVDGVLADAQHNPLRFQHPMGMAFDSEGKLYVVELKANRVAVLSLAQAAGGPP